MKERPKLSMGAAKIMSQLSVEIAKPSTRIASIIIQITEKVNVKHLLRQHRSTNLTI